MPLHSLKPRDQPQWQWAVPALGCRSSVEVPRPKRGGHRRLKLHAAETHSPGVMFSEATQCPLASHGH